MELYETGLGARRIAKILSVSVPTVGVWARKHGVSRTPKQSGEATASRHPMSWGELNPERAWLLGYIYGDGGIKADGNAVTISIDNRDEDLVAKIRLVLRHQFGISRREGQIQMNIGSRQFARRLREDFGLDEKKCHLMPWPEGLDPGLTRHFVRGLFDSDGSWYFRKARQSEQAIASYASVARHFVIRLERTIFQNVEVCPRTVRTVSRTSGTIDGRKINGGDYYSLDYSHHDAINLGRWIYEGDTDLIRCTRKYESWLKGSTVVIGSGWVTRHLRHRAELRAVVNP